MQSVFRSIPSLPSWTTGNTLNKAVAPFVAHADLPGAGNANGKRKRNLENSPRSSPVPAPKKIKNIATDIGGAVRPAPRQLLRGPDGTAMAKNAVMSAIAPKPVDTVQYCAGTGSFDVRGHHSGYAPPSYYWQGQYSGPMQSVQQPYVVNVGEEIIANVQDGQRVSASCPPLASAQFVAPQTVQSVVSPVDNTPAPNTTSLANAQGSSVGPEVVATPAVASNKSLVVDATTVVPQIVAPAFSVQVTPYLPSVQQQKSLSKAKDQSAPPKAKAIRKMDVNMDHVRAACTLQIDTAIVFKHNELRLIDLEIAKCQVALEQIRRCQLIPYPALQGFSVDVATHSGSSMLAPAGLVAPQYPAPWGVTDGPYTQHYAPWLIQSGHFDPRMPETGTPINSPYTHDGRATRNSGPEVTPLSATFSSARSARASIGRGRHSLDGQSSQPQRDPLVIKRNADNQWVKLYCAECQPERSNFANVQGFLNHCRISHKLDYKSHESAAIACGRIVQLSESMLEPEPVSARDPAPKASFSVPSFDSSVRPGVHSFITGSIKGRENKHAVEQILPRSYSVNDRVSTGLSTPTTPTVSPDFKAATTTPYLSQMMAKSGFGGDFAATVEISKRKEDLSVYDESESGSDTHTAKKQKTNRKKGSLSGVKIKVKAKPTSRGPSTISTPSFGPLKMDSAVHTFQSLDSPMSEGSGMPTPSEPMDHEMNLSPHGADSNPGLVSDRDEDDDEMDEDEPSPTDMTRRGEESEMMITIEDGEGETSQVEDSTQRICAVNGTTTC